MNSLRDSLPEGLLVQMQKELGREETLRLLWPLVVGANLAASTRLVAVRQNRLRIAVPDRTWKRTLGSMETIILAAVHRICGEEVGGAIDWVEDPTLGAARAPHQKSAGLSPPAAPPASPASMDLPLDLPFDLPLGGISDAELRRMFRQSAAKYFARGARRARRAGRAGREGARQ